VYATYGLRARIIVHHLKELNTQLTNEEADDFSFYIKNSWMAHLKTWSRRKVLQNILTLMPRMTRQKKEILFGSLWNLHPLANPRMLLET